MRRSVEWLWAARMGAGVSALFCAAMTALLILLLVDGKLRGPLVDEELPAIKRELRASAADAAARARLEEKYRLTDARIRADFELREERMNRAAYALLGGAIVLVVCIKAIRQLSRRQIGPADLVAAMSSAPGRVTAYPVIGVAGALIIGTVAIAALAVTQPGAQSLLPRESAAAIVFPSTDTLKANWPVFRGWGGSGIVGGGVYVRKWDGKSGENVVWKSPLLLEGHSSPIVWNDRVFITGASDESRAVYCYDARDGKLLWTGEVPITVPDGTKVYEETGNAASTPATDGTHVYAAFGSGDVAAFDFSGRRVWQKYMGRPESQYGFSASLTVWAGNVIVQWDMGASEKSGLSSLVALDGATGKVAWKTPRPVQASWGSPVVTDHGKIVATGTPWVAMYDGASGAEAWRAKLMDIDLACTPAVVGSRVYVSNDHAVTAAIKADGTGDVTASHVLWQHTEGRPDTVSPTTDGTLLWTLTAGALFCFDAATGETVYEQPVGSVQASPALVGDALWITDGRGVTKFVSTGRKYEELGTAALGEKMSASAAFARGRVFLRGSRHLWCIGPK